MSQLLHLSQDAAGVVDVLEDAIGGLPEEHEADILDGETSVVDIRFVLFGEPADRVVEDVDVARRIKAQLEKLRK